ncbi:MAG: ribose 5-phosphate isomerase B [Gemmatimonadaceae bacterium]
MRRRPVITERDVRRAAREAQTTIDASGATVTPSAFDVARKLGIALSGTKGEDRLARSSGKPHDARPAGDAARASAAAPARAPSTATEPAKAVLRISVGADHGGLALKDSIAQRLRELGHQIADRGTTTADAVDYPDYAALVARDVAAGVADIGIMVDGAGIGSCMAANKIAGVRAAMCYDVTTARNAREHNHANMLTLGGGLIGTRLALEIVDAFLSTPFGGGRHAARVAKINALQP